MDCFNNGCPFRVNDTSNANRCECTACPNKCTNDVIIVSDHTLDAVPVVRCRECKHWTDWGACGHPRNGWDAAPMGPEDFCSRGERR